MLRIAIPSTGPSQLTFNSFENYDIPAPPNGVDAEINNDVLLLFDDEQQALEYADNLYEIGDTIEDDTKPQKATINDIVAAIYGNDFIKSYRDNA